MSGGITAFDGHWLSVVPVFVLAIILTPAVLLAGLFRHARSQASAA